MTTHYKITSAITDGTNLTIITDCCEQTGTRKDEHGNDIPICNCRTVTVAILIDDLPITGKLDYIKIEIETAYAALPNQTLVKQLIGKTWSN